MDVHDYLLDQDGIDWAQCLREWAWLLPRELTVWLVSRFGDIFTVLADGSVHMLDVGAGSFTKLADSRDEFGAKLDEHVDDWLLVPLVDMLVAAGITLAPGQCYGFKLSPVLGGKYAIDNIAAIAVWDCLGCWGSVHGQMKDLPDGGQVVIEIVNGARSQP